MEFKNLIQQFIIIPFRSGRLWFTLFRLPSFFRQLREYRSRSLQSVEVRHINLQLQDATSVTAFDPHYFYQSAWCARKIAEQNPKHHVDIASQINLIAPLSAFVEVEFIDYRPLEVNLKNLTSRSGTILDLPFKDHSVKSLSSLHVIEHIGLGRYGDELDPEGSKKSCKELQRILAVKGNLYLSTPVGNERIEFNAHRIHFPQTIIEYFNELQLISFSLVNDDGVFIENADPKTPLNFRYGLGMFHFRRGKK